MLRILFVTSLFSTPTQPTRSPPNTRIAHAMKRLANIKVMSPLPYYPKALLGGRPDLREIADAPAVERDVDGDEILHPRYLHIPRFARSLYPLLYAASIARPVARQVLEFRPDVILSAWTYPDGVAAVALAKAFGLPSVLRVMGSDVNAYGLEPLRRFQIAWALRNATRVISVSKALMESCVDVAGNEVRPFIDVIPTGVDSKRFYRADQVSARAALGIADGPPLIVVPARLSLEKGVHHFLNAFAGLEGSPRAIIVGDGPEATRLKAQADSLGIHDRVVFAGHQDENRMRLHYSAADLVCLPSTEEGWPNVLIESFACGCPWVASSVGGVPEVARLADGGVLARPGDVPDLRRALDLALHRDWDRAAIAAGGASISLDDTACRYVGSCEKARLTYQGLDELDAPRESKRSPRRRFENRESWPSFAAR